MKEAELAVLAELDSGDLILLTLMIRTCSL
jgi:hypothetical protein